jgi:hypothetical protein
VTDFCEVAGLVDVATAAHCDVIGQQLQWDADDRGTPGGRGRRRRLCARLRRSQAHATGPSQKGELAEAEHNVTWILRERRDWWKRPRAEVPARFPSPPRDLELDSLERMSV